MAAPAVVLIPDRERRPTALGTIRCLASAGVPVIAVSSSRNTFSFFSRHVSRRVLLPALGKNPEQWALALAKFACSLANKPVLYASADDHVWAIHRYREELSHCVHYPFLTPSALLCCIDKREMYRQCQAAGIETGKVLLVPDPDHPQDVADQAVFPSVLKPAAWVDLSNSRPHLSRPFQQEFGSKALSVVNREQLHQALARVARLSIPVLLQEEIPGPARAIRWVSLYADRTSSVRGLFVARKRRQYPSNFGAACLLETDFSAEVAELATSVVRAIGFHGLAGAIEFKRHSQTGRLHFIEINPRAPGGIWAAHAGGVNLPYFAYLDAIGEELPSRTVGDKPVRWIDAQKDFLYWLKYRKGDHTGQALSLGEYFRSLQGRREFAYWAVDDPLPALAHAATLPGDFLLFIRNRLKRAEEDKHRKRYPASP